MTFGDLQVHFCSDVVKELSPVSTSRVNGPSTRLVETRTRQHVLTGNGNRSPVNSGRQLGPSTRALMFKDKDLKSEDKITRTCKLVLVDPRWQELSSRTITLYFSLLQHFLQYIENISCITGVQIGTRCMATRLRMKRCIHVCYMTRRLQHTRDLHRRKLVEIFGDQKSAVGWLRSWRPWAPMGWMHPDASWSIADEKKNRTWTFICVLVYL